MVRSEGHRREELGFWGEPGERVFAAVTTLVEGGMLSIEVAEERLHGSGNQ